MINTHQRVLNQTTRSSFSPPASKIQTNTNCSEIVHDETKRKTVGAFRRNKCQFLLSPYRPFPRSRWGHYLDFWRSPEKRDNKRTHAKVCQPKLVHYLPTFINHIWKLLCISKINMKSLFTNKHFNDIYLPTDLLLYLIYPVNIVGSVWTFSNYNGQIRQHYYNVLNPSFFSPQNWFREHPVHLIS